MLNPRYVRSFVRTNKTDAADARAIWTAALQPGMPSVPVKTEAQQALLGLHRIRSELVDTRTRRVNQLRGLLGEFGLHFTAGRHAGLAEIRARREEIENAVPPVLWSALARQLDEIRREDEQILEIEREIANWLRSHPAGQTVEEIPGIGPITASALVATMGSAQAFRSGRAFAASLGLVPRQSGSGGKVQLGGISKRGDPYLRRLLIHGARIVLTRSRKRPAWAEALLARRPTPLGHQARHERLGRSQLLPSRPRSYHRTRPDIGPQPIPNTSKHLTQTLASGRCSYKGSKPAGSGERHFHT
ncbi:Mobile element protein [Cupriavidus necator H850]|nr:IS110 family transposase [Cupriavidus necator]KAI3597350.1 Mobile element protein [Cupriavidus necator H850]